MKGIIYFNIILCLAGCSSINHFDTQNEMMITDSKNPFSILSSKTYPGTYKPANFDLPVCDKDQEQKQLELSKLMEHNLISHQEFKEKQDI